jgi:hypothetical protein
MGSFSAMKQFSNRKEGRNAARECRRSQALIPKQFLELVPRRRFSRFGLFFGENTADKAELLAKIPAILFLLGFRDAIPALMGRLGIVADAIQAHAQVGAALVAPLAPPRLPRQGIFQTAMMTVSSHNLRVYFTAG